MANFPTIVIVGAGGEKDEMGREILREREIQERERGQEERERERERERKRETERERASAREKHKESNPERKTGDFASDTERRVQAQGHRRGKGGSDFQSLCQKRGQ